MQSGFHLTTAHCALFYIGFRPIQKAKMSPCPNLVGRSYNARPDATATIDLLVATRGCQSTVDIHVLMLPSPNLKFPFRLLLDLLFWLEMLSASS
jgi:hypothetical protein